METKELVIDILNAAIDAFASNGHKVYPSDKVVDYNVESVRIAPFTDRHPGWIKLYVQLEKGTGEFFLSMESDMFGNTYYIAWEADDGFHTTAECLRHKFPKGSVEPKIFKEYYRQVRQELEDIILKGLFNY